MVILPLGSLEDHGSLPAQLDTLLAVHASCILAGRCNGLLAWPLGYGYSPIHRYWSGPGSGELLEELLEDILHGLRGMGASKLVVVDGHYGHREAARRAAKRAGALYLNVWELMRDLDSWEKQLRFEEMYAQLLLGGEGGRESPGRVVEEAMERAYEALAPLCGGAAKGAVRSPGDAPPQTPPAGGGGW